ncbi:MAG: hypothetical protein K0S33_3004 [Bacteroidetes bacterium]|jgi:hypothetical protein|nr:hypothetical protein [Bacteroidota bacterium]
MKRLKNILILSFLFLFATETFGVYKFVHFCGEEKTAESFYIEKNDCCCGDDEDESDDCCTDQTAVIQLKEETSLVSAGFLKTPDNIATELFYDPTEKTEFASQSWFSTISKVVYQHSLYSKPPLLIKHCIFLI